MGILGHSPAARRSLRLPQRFHTRAPLAPNSSDHNHLLGTGNRVHWGKGVNIETDNSLGGSRLGEPSAFLQRRARLLFGDGKQTNMNLAEPSRLENCNEQLRLSDCHRGTALARQPLKLSAGPFTAAKRNPEQSMLEVLGCCLSLRLL